MPSIRRISKAAYGTATGKTGADWTTNAMGKFSEAIVTAGDEVRVEASTDNDLGVTGAFSKGSAATPNRYIQLSAGVLATKAKLIDACEAGWVKAAGGDLSTVGYGAGITKNGTASKLTLTFGATPHATTLQAYKVVSNLSLSAFQNLTFWCLPSTGAMLANALVIKLCTGNDGVTGVVATLTQADLIAAGGYGNASIGIDNGSALPDGINSIAIYTGAVVPAASVVWVFDTFYATIAGFDLNSVLHKPWKTQWTASETVALNDIRRPTWAYHSKCYYKCTVGGQCGATEPIWDNAVLGDLGSFAAQTIVDGAATWKCMGDDEGWYFFTIKSFQIATDRIEIDNDAANQGNNGRGYYGTDETVEIWYFTPILPPIPTNWSTVADTTGGNGIAALLINVSGGWTSPGGVDTITGVSVINWRNSSGLLYLQHSYIHWNGGFGFVRFTFFGTNGSASTVETLVRNIVITSHAVSGINGGLILCIAGITTLQHVISMNGGSYSNGISVAGGMGSRNCYGITCISNISAIGGTTFSSFTSKGNIFANCGNTGLKQTTADCLFVNTSMSLNGTASLATMSTYAANDAFNGARFKNLLTTDSAVIHTGSNWGSKGILVQGFGGVPGDNRAYYPLMGYATFATSTWTIAVNNVNASLLFPMRHKVGVIACRVAGVQYTVSLAVNPSNAALIAALKILGNTIAGVGADLSQSSSGAGLQTLTLTFTPLETGPVEVYLDLWLTNATLTYTCTYSLNSFAGTQSGVAMRVRAIGDELFGDERVMAEQIATFPDATKVVDVATGGPASWGYPDGSTLGPGTAVSASSVILPTAGETWDGRAQYGIPGSLITPTRVDAIVSKVQSGYKYGDPAAQKTGTLVLLTPIRISSIKPIYAPKSGGALCEMVMRDAGATAGTIVLTMPDDSFEAITPIRWENELISFLVPASAELGLCDITVTADDTTTDTVDAAFEYVEDDCITARITADIVATLETLDSYGGVPGKVEEEKLIHAPNGRYPYVEVCGPVGSPNPQTTKVAMTELRYTIKHYTQANDEGDANPAISYLARNIIADIVKCLMVDQTRGNIALSTEQEEFGNAFLVDEASGAVEFCVYVNIMVRTRIDVNNPYSLG